jgi:hypothetical protein
MEPGSVDDRVDSARKALAVLNEEIRKEGKQLETEASRQKTMFTWSRALTALFGVAAPALVTYQTQVQGTGWQLAAILLTSMAGAAATLQAIFGWGERYGRTRMAALNLREILFELETQGQRLGESSDKIESYAKLRSLGEASGSRYRKTIRDLIESEVALVSQQEVKPGAMISGGAEA